MRVALGLVGLVLAVIATGACEEPFSKEPYAIDCVAALEMQADSGDAATAWRTFAERKFGESEVAEYVPAAIEMYRQYDPGEVERVAARCLTTAPPLDEA